MSKKKKKQTDYYLRQLEKNAGLGNYDVVDGHLEGDDDDDFDDDFDDFICNPKTGTSL